MKRRRNALKTILIFFGATLLLFAAASAVFLYAELSKINMPESLDRIDPENEIFETDDDGYGAVAPEMEPADIDWTDHEKTDVEVQPVEQQAAEHHIINILLIGQDKRPGEKRARSDAMIIASYNPKDSSLKLISLLRDMYVPIPGYSDNRINAAYQFGGMALLDKTIKKDFGVSVDGNIEVSFEGFTKLVDMLGGLDIDLNKAEAKHLNNKFGWKLPAGVNHLDGEETLEYARIRYVGKGDFERTDRQRIVLTKIFDKAMQLSTVKKYKLLDQMLPYLTTDMTKQALLGYAYTVLTNGISSTKSFRIPAEGAYKSARIRKMAVLVPNLKKARIFLNQCIFE